MKLYRLCSKKYADDISGTGAALYGGRWNPRGVPMLYTSESISLALLENLVHVNPIHFPELDLITFEVPDDEISNLNTANLPSNWKQYPAPTSLAEIGREWAISNESVALCVPSAIVPDSNNYLFNCQHPNYSDVKKICKEDFVFDRRLYNNVFGTVR